MNNGTYTLDSKDVQLQETLLDVLKNAYYNNKTVVIPADLLKEVLDKLEVYRYF